MRSDLRKAARLEMNRRVSGFRVDSEFSMRVCDKSARESVLWASIGSCGCGGSFKAKDCKEIKEVSEIGEKLKIPPPYPSFSRSSHSNPIQLVLSSSTRSQSCV